MHIVYLGDSGEANISYGDLQRQVDFVATGLQRAGLEPRQTAAIMLPTGPEYFHAYFGILRAGGIPVPIYPPARLSQVGEHVRRHAGILSNAGATILVTVPEARGVARLLEARVTRLNRVVTMDELTHNVGEPQPVHVKQDDIAFILYTSGSTGDPKGVVLTHANLLANIRAIGEVIAVRPGDVLVSWLPLYHDMGLISMWLASLYFAIPLVVMFPLAFLARPERWLRTIQRYRGTVSAAPNFAYELCVKRIDDAQIDGLDLGSWRLAANGAEPVLPETLHRFSERFARYVEGRLEFRGRSATGGYYRNPGETRRLFDGDWLDTGDRAYLADAEVHLTGRVKDIIIRGGRNRSGSSGGRCSRKWSVWRPRAPISSTGFTAGYCSR